MKKHLAVVLGVLAIAMLVAAPSFAQGPLKIGVILPYTGQFADGATQMDDGIKLYMKQHGDTVAGRKIEIIRKDVGGIAPDVAKRLAQELIVRDKADILAGFLLTPNALAAGDVSKEAKKFMVVMNAATSIITLKSPYMARTSMTLPQTTGTIGRWAYKHGVRKVYTMVSDYGPGHDAESEFTRQFKEAGGTIVGSVRMAVRNPDFSAYVRRAKDVNPDAIFVFVPGGSQPAALAKALVEVGMDPNKVLVMGQGELTGEDALKAMGKLALGIVTVFHYDYNHQSPTNKAFVSAFNAEFHRNPDFFAVGGYDGMHLIYEALKKTGGNSDATALIDASKGMSWESPRGHITIDPETRDVINPIYINKVEDVGGKLLNVEIDKYNNVKDPVKERMDKK